MHERFEALFERHRGIVGKVARLYAFDPDERQDLAQEIAAQLWRSFARYDATRAFSTWMYRVALNVAISAARHRERRPRAAAEVAVEELADARDGPLERDPRWLALQRIVEGLDPLERALLLLHLDERPYREIAEVLGIRETNVATKLSRVKKRLRKDVGADDQP